MNPKPSILRILDRMGGKPMTTQALIDSVRLVHPTANEGDITRFVKRCQSDGLVAGSYSELLETDVWVLTDAGRIALSQL